MNKMVSLLAAGAIAFSPAMTLAGPGGHGNGMGHGATMGSMGQGGGSHGGAAMGGHAMGMGNAGGMSKPNASPTNGGGWDHLNSPAHETGQAFFECEDTRPGQSSSAKGSAFNEDGTAGTKYAGEQPQNSRNTSSVSQYDTACMHQPQH